LKGIPVAATPNPNVTPNVNGNPACLVAVSLVELLGAASMISIVRPSDVFPPQRGLALCHRPLRFTVRGRCAPQWLHNR